MIFVHMLPNSRHGIQVGFIENAVARYQVLTTKQQLEFYCMKGYKYTLTKQNTDILFYNLHLKPQYTQLLQ